MGVGKYMASERFTAGDYQWAIHFYPDGKNAEHNSLYVSAYIVLSSKGTDVRSVFELTLLDQSTNIKHKVYSQGSPRNFKHGDRGWGWKRFYYRGLLEISDYLKNDTLLMRCTVGVLVSSTQPTKSYSISVPEPDLGQHFSALLDRGEGDTVFGDVTFVVDGEVFQAHKVVLAARSPVFKAQFYGPLRYQDSDKIYIKEMEAPVFKAMLHFIYRDVLPDTNEVIESTSSSSTMLAQHLLAAADRYGLHRLQLLCESKLCENLSTDTVATILGLAEKHHAAQLKAVCLKYAVANLAAMKQSDGFWYLKHNFPSLHLELLETIAGVRTGTTKKQKCM